MFERSFFHVSSWSQHPICRRYARCRLMSGGEISRVSIASAAVIS